ncbi:MAG TPA: HEAT repeat domain-containing protein [Gemmataceae bacterium]|nr:HEAT repeat domain-containing protein [Gemmataceae bacterium]
MRLLRHSWHFLTFPIGIAALSLLALAGAPQPAAAQYTDPVEDLRTILKNVNDPESQVFLEARKKALEEAAEKLTATSDKRQALALLEWRDTDDVFKGLAAVDLAARQKIGQRLEEIIKTVVSKGDSTSKLAAASLLGEMGTSVRALDPLDKRGFARHLAPNLIQLSKSEDAKVRQAAARALAKVDPEPKAAVQALKDLLESSQLADRQSAAQALGDVVATIIDLQKKGRPGGESVITVYDVIICANEAVLAAGPCFDDKDLLVRRNGLQTISYATTALNDLVPLPEKPELLPPPSGPYTDRQLKQLRELHMVLANEAKMFGPLEEALKGQGQNIANMLDDPDVELRLWSRKALEQMAAARNKIKRRQESVPPLPGDPPLSKTLPDPLKAGLEPGIMKIAKHTTDPDKKVRMASLQFLEAMEDAAVPAIDTIIAALKDSNKFIRWAAARTLGKIGPDYHADKTVPALAALMNPQEDSDVREVTASALRKFGAAAKPALPQLIKLLNIGEAEAQEAIIKAITAIGGPETTPAIPALIKSLDSRNVNVRKLAAEALGRMGPLAVSAIPALTDHLQDEDATVRIAISDALLNIARPR